MTLRPKINLIMGALTLLFVIAMSWLQLHNMRDSVLEEMVAANRVAAQVLNRTVGRYASRGTPEILDFLQGMGRVRSNDITLLDLAGSELYRSPPSTYKAGRDAPEWFVNLISSQPSIQTIDLSDGKLLVRSNASRAILDAWDTLKVLAASGLLLLLLVNTLVFWIVGQTVRPFGKIVKALNQLQGGRLDVKLPRLAGTEATAIGAAFNRMVDELQIHIETERRAVRAELKLSDSRELTRWIDQHIERERLLIARELHDELGQSVTAIRSMALSIAQRIQGLDPQAETAARLIADESSRLYDAMHGMIPRLTPLVLDNFGLAEALDELLVRTRLSQPQVLIESTIEIGSTALASDTALTLYRAAQEGISNALRHGQARHLQLSIANADDMLTLTLQDDGLGLAADWSLRKGHYGLRWLTERAEGVGGELRVEAGVSGGVLLLLRLPLLARPEAAAE
ncbi:MAG: two-component system sensor histidine kinase UhpB [Polaromonas sp.]|jgi:two-component system sensor histidine kinase UhpB